MELYVKNYSEIVAISIERALFDVTTTNIWKNVEKKLADDYNSKFIDSYDHPEYIKSILDAHYSEFKEAFVHSLKGFLAEFTIDENLDSFLSKLES